MDIRKVIIIAIVVVCVFALGFGVYLQVFMKNGEEPKDNTLVDESLVSNAVEFDDLFDNKLNYQTYNVNNDIKINQTLDLVYTSYSLNEIYEGKYEINASIPLININNERIINIDREIEKIFREKLDSIIANSAKEDAVRTIYTVDYTAYINENILSLVIKSTLKEGNNVQRLIIKAYTYNLSTHEEIPLSSMLEIKGISPSIVDREIKRVVQEGISYTDNLAALGYTVFERDINSEIYYIENSNNYLLGPDGVIYIIYAYGNSNYTSEKDIVIIE